MALLESETLELKKSTSEIKEAVISIAAMLNKHGKGEVIFGVEDDGCVVGQGIGKKTLREVSKTISDHIEPKTYPKIREETIDGKHCIRVAADGALAPYFAYGRAYMRTADEDRLMSAGELEHIIVQKTATRWDSGASDCAIDDIDEATLKDFILRANQSQRIKFGYTDKFGVLGKLGLLKGSKITNAARLLFSGKEPIEVQAAVFAGTDKTTFLDIKQFKGNLFQLLTLSESYIKEHIDWRAKLEGRTRQEIPEIPLRAITESLVNSLCHRDYQAPESNKIAIFKDHVEIWNPGGFPDGVTPQDFVRHDIPSILRNPLIANTLYLSSDIEKWGSGLRRISEECRDIGVNVSFNLLKYGFAVRFGRWKRPSSGSVGGGARKGPEKGQKILAEIAQNPAIGRHGLATILGISEKAVRHQLELLKQKGILSRIGPDKGGRWEIIRPKKKG